MTARQLSSLVIALIGFYMIYCSIWGAGVQLLLMVSAALGGEWDVFGYNGGSEIVQFVVPFILGLVIVRKSYLLGLWVCQRGRVDESLQISMPNLEIVSVLAFALLGIFMLVQELSEALSTVGYWFHLGAMGASSRTQAEGFSSEHFWQNHFPTIVYHFAALGFSLFVFLRGKSISKFVWSLRK